MAPYTVPGQLNMVHTGNYAGLVFSSRGDEANTAGAHQDWASLSQTDTVPAGSSCLSAWFAASLNGFHYVNGYAYGSDAYVSFTVAVGGNTIYSQRFSWFDNAAQLVSPGLPYSSNTYADGDCPYACVNILTNPIEDYPDVPGPWKYLPWTQYTYDMAAYVGQTVTISYAAYNCDEYQHYSFGYIDDVTWGACPPTPTPTSTKTPSNTFTVSPSFTQSSTFTPSPTFSQTFTQRDTASATPTLSVTLTPSPSFTATPSATPSDSPTASPTATASSTATPTATPTATATQTATATDSPTATDTATDTETATATATATDSPTATASFTDTPTDTPTATATATLTATATFTDTRTDTETDTETASPTDTATSTATPTATPTSTDTETATDSPTATATPTYSFSFTATATRTATPTATDTPTATPSSTATATATDTRTDTPTPTLTATPTDSPSDTPTASPSDTPTRSDTPTHTATYTVTSTFSDSPTFTASPTITQTFTPAPNLMVNLTVYNSAGEVVVVLPSVEVYTMPTGVVTGVTSFSPDEGQTVQINFGGDTEIASWNGTNANGQRVANGVYTIQAVTNNGFGQTTAYTAAVQVIEAATGLVLEVYNSAGEGVRRIITSAALASQLVLSFTTLVPPPSADGVSSGVKVDLGNGNTAWWNGRNDLGNVVAPGLYLLQVRWVGSGNQVETLAKPVTVLGVDVADPLGTAWLGPNPASSGSGAMVVGLAPGIDTAGLTGQVYTLSGQKVANLEAGTNGRMAWVFNRTAPGVYLIQLRMVDPTSGVMTMRVLKAAVLP